MQARYQAPDRGRQDRSPTVSHEGGSCGSASHTPAPTRSRTALRPRIVAFGAAAGVLAVAGAAYASTAVFGHNQVGTEYANGIQVSDDQIVKPIGDRLLTQFGKFMGSTVSPDGRFLAATSTDRSVALQIFDLSSYKLIWTVGHRVRGQPEADQQHRRSGRPDVLAGRQVALASGAGPA